MAEKVGEIYYDVTLDTSKVIDGTRVVTREVDKAASSFNAITAAVKLLAVAMTALKIMEMADELRMLSARAEVAAGSIEDGALAMNELVAVSRRTQTSLAGNVDVFTRLNQAIVSMGGNQRDTLQVTELLAKAIRVSGANAVEAKAAMLQFGQALGSGKLQGDELRSLMETSQYLMKQLADAMGVPVGALKKLGEEGKLTADVITNALIAASAKIEADFAKFPTTVGSAMTVAKDSAALAALKFDELSGSSAALAGATNGLSEVLDELAKQFGAANEQAGGLGRNDAVKSWADETKIVLSYVVDAADVAWQALSVLGRNVVFVFKGVTSEIKGIGQQILAVAQGDFARAAALGDAMKSEADRRRKELDAADAATLSKTKLAGQQMREAWERGAAGYGRGLINPTMGGPTKLKPPAGVGDDKKKGAKFDGAAYLAGLAKDAAENPLEKINVVEREALRKNDELLKASKISHEQHAQAVTLIEKNAADERMALQLRAAEERRKLIEDAGEQELAAKKKLEDQQRQGQQFARDTIVAEDPVAKLQFELEQKSALLASYAALDQDNLELYAAAKLALEQQTTEAITAEIEKRRAAEAAAQSAQLMAYSNLFAGIADVTKAFAGKQSGIYKAMFAASKAFAIADSIVKIQQGIANAAGRPFPENLAAMGSVIAATSSIVSTISGTQYGGGRQYGGPVSAGSLYRVNETGRPEMFTASNGNQFLLPTANGSVTAADKVGGGVQVNVQVINQHPTAQVTQRTGEGGQVQLVISEVARQFRENDGPIWDAARSSTNIASRL
ncbi:tape measure protein [Aquincola tertiaricarbonis]|uniref:Tape measure protein n=1 Tax=Aquincola tertiaricarbonis TaxID=391953 RepID=A0ABY4SAK8_AQUTE|nr:tape measure protein [Aquincola tertiaricarbonis]URI08778.1 tape measure protein [Aquincola tertiaricarbonis]